MKEGEEAGFTWARRLSIRAHDLSGMVLVFWIFDWISATGESRSSFLAVFLDVLGILMFFKRLMLEGFFIFGEIRRFRLIDSLRYVMLLCINFKSRDFLVSSCVFSSRRVYRSLKIFLFLEKSFDLLYVRTQKYVSVLARIYEKTVNKRNPRFSKIADYSI